MSDHEADAEDPGEGAPWDEPTQAATPPPNPWGQAPGAPGAAPPPQSPPPQSPPPGYGAPGGPNQWGGPPPTPQGGFPAPPGAGPFQSGQFAAAGGPYSQFSESSQADIALGLSTAGTLSLFLAFCCGPIGLFSLIASGAGAFLAHQEITAIDAGRRDPLKRGNAVAARIIGAIGVSLCLLGIIGFGILVAVG